MKYPNAKHARNQAIKEYHQAHPELSLKEVGAVFGGLTKQRVSAIIKRQIICQKT